MRLSRCAARISAAATPIVFALCMLAFSWLLLGCTEESPDPSASTESPATGLTGEVTGAVSAATTTAAGPTSSTTVSPESANPGTTVAQSPTSAPQSVATTHVTQVTGVLSVDTEEQGVKGVAKDFDTGEPLAGVRVEGGGATVISDADGAFMLKVCIAKGLELIASKDGYFSARSLVGGEARDGYWVCDIQLVATDSPNAPPPPPGL
ncbi:MAG: hypothetical protein JW990_14060 [Thermoleophilia bacterium]|nr:hypothetical protein [Thermoleophilia bacterium]